MAAQVMILVHASPTTLAPYRTENLGILNSPRRVYGDEMNGWPWAADNDAFSKWDEGRYREMLERIRGREGCLFVTAPDVVGDAAQTLRNFDKWRPELDDFPVALVGQDGLENPPWDAFSTFFVGGSTEWKLGIQAARLIREAKERGKWVHLGRCNSFKRVRYGQALGCDSFDGSRFNQFRDVHLPPMLAALRRASWYREAIADAGYIS